LLAETRCGGLPAARQAKLASIREEGGNFIDQGIVLFFPGPNSFTGEDCLELQVHGGRATVAALLTELGKLSGFRTAEAGEFTRRAFENGKLNLVEIEGLADLIAAETEMQRRLAVDLADGALSAQYSDWADTITRARALLEAGIDFADEDDIPADVAESIRPAILRVAAEIKHHVDGFRFGEIVRDGYRIVIAGPPNAGKSSLLNALARQDIAIVSDIAGTTRDVISIDLDLGGYKVRISDTAGLREAVDPIERIGVDRAMKEIARADLVLVLHDGANSGVYDGLEVVDDSSGIDRLDVMTKSDILPETEPLPDGWLAISSWTQDGFDSLTKYIEGKIEGAKAPAGATIPTRLRQVEHLRNSRRFLIDSLEKNWGRWELVAEHLRLAGDEIGRLTGKVGVEDLLEVIFSEFCVGK
jgi:tRNA modification GTPase